MIFRNKIIFRSFFPYFEACSFKHAVHYPAKRTVLITNMSLSFAGKIFTGFLLKTGYPVINFVYIVRRIKIKNYIKNIEYAVCSSYVQLFI